MKVSLPVWGVFSWGSNIYVALFLRNMPFYFNLLGWGNDQGKNMFTP